MQIIIVLSSHHWFTMNNFDIYLIYCTLIQQGFYFVTSRTIKIFDVILYYFEVPYEERDTIWFNIYDSDLKHFVTTLTQQGITNIAARTKSFTYDLIYSSTIKVFFTVGNFARMWSTYYCLSQFKNCESDENRARNSRGRLHL